jgi:hypothetical protein
MAMMDELIPRFRLRMLDVDPAKNTLLEELEFTDDQVRGFILESFYDINESEPRTSYTLDQFPKTSLLLDGALVFALQARGLIQLRNQLSYSDAGFSVNLDDKSGNYAQWLSMITNRYLTDRKELKRSIVPRFRGVGSPMRWWYRD